MSKKIFGLGLLIFGLASLCLVSDADARGVLSQRSQRTTITSRSNGFRDVQRIQTTTRSGFLGLNRRQESLTIINGNRGFQEVRFQDRGRLGRNRVDEIRFQTGPAYVNQQLLIDNHARQRLLLNRQHSFTHAPRNNVANIRFIDRGPVYLNAPPITRAEIRQEYVYRQPAQVIERVEVAPQTAADCDCEQVGNAQYQTEAIVTRRYTYSPQLALERRQFMQHHCR